MTTVTSANAATATVATPPVPEAPPIEIPAEIIEAAAIAACDGFMTAAKASARWVSITDTDKHRWRAAAKAAINAASAEFNKKPAEALAQEPPRHAKQRPAGSRW